MELIMLESKVWKQLLYQIETPHDHYKEVKKEPYKSVWFNHHEVYAYLHMSPSTLTQMRNVGELIDSENKRQHFHNIRTLRSLLGSRMLRSKKKYRKNLVASAKHHLKQ